MVVPLNPIRPLPEQFSPETAPQILELLPSPAEVAGSGSVAPMNTATSHRRPNVALPIKAVFARPSQICAPSNTLQCVAAMVKPTAATVMLRWIGSALRAKESALTTLLSLEEEVQVASSAAVSLAFNVKLASTALTQLRQSAVLLIKVGPAFVRQKPALCSMNQSAAVMTKLMATLVAQLVPASVLRTWESVKAVVPPM